MFFNGWETLLRTVVVGVLSYIGLIFILRISGKRTLSKMNAFDLVVTVALGSILATILLSKDVALSEGLTAFIVLIGMQYIVAWSSVRFRIISKLIKSEPKLLFYEDSFLKETMKSERILEEEIFQAARSSGLGSLDDVTAVILETDGSISVIQSESQTSFSTLSNLKKD
ncbi:hypothetical protein CSV80_15205 [Sporosarcina sp. P12(2017)]|uniref:DUF421 domain-containing protein n=1 Tax=unclassified Sporosarcina TaxID=2647733 RepID=UPI000C162E6A|nr:MULTISPECIES: YetF domain-containing protein [unclassified Sporosarcina]PIC56110.1 hypothetical protein CSV81_16050 [Sporosarcina sp. P10]PIC59619.1 hypothetical protein CSV80_15205 [Sporosarcina sp. P12(2017)]